MIDATKGLKKNERCEVTEDFINAFKAGRDALADAVMLHHPEPGAELAISVDASQFGLGAELAQRGRSGRWEPLCFFSSRLTATQQKYLAFDLGRVHRDQEVQTLCARPKILRVHGPHALDQGADQPEGADAASDHTL